MFLKSQFLVKRGLAGGRAAAAVLFDFRAAFPSISREFMFAALHNIAMPEFVLNAIQQLYSNDKHFFHYSAICKYAFTPCSGVRQGCPASRTLFSLCTSCILHYIGSELSPLDKMCACADDIAIALHHVLHSEEQVHRTFKKVGLGSGLLNNKDKCIMVPCRYLSHARPPLLGLGPKGDDFVAFKNRLRHWRFF